MGLAIAVCGAFGGSAPGWAQQDAPGAVVQPLVRPEVDALNEALLRLAEDARDVSALVDAGRASLKLNDIDAAIGFFSRASELSPQDSRAKAGLGAAFVRGENPYDALLLFDEAERAGASPALLAGDRGLAHDLVGDSVTAQSFYRQALALGPDDEVRRRLALSLAITGKRNAFEDTLLPLLEKGDMPAFRTRAFGLAILGADDEAARILDAVMPKEMAQRIRPYLRHMPKLTSAQQAAAAHFGHFPPAADIGEDDPRISRYARKAATKRDASRADMALVPEGRALGSPAVGKAAASSPVRQAARDQRGELPPARPASAPQPLPAPVSATPPAEPAPTPAVPPATPPASTSDGALASKAAQDRPQAGQFDLGSLSGSRTGPLAEARSSVGAASSPGTVQQPIATPVENPAAQLTEAFSGLGKPAAPQRPVSGAVDITRIDPPRDEREEKPKRELHPSRLWVQVATGRDLKALAFDWRRFARKAPEAFKGQSAHVTPWGQANRLLAGPFAEPAKAKEFMKALSEAGIDTFTFTSAEGQAIDPLGS